MPYMFEGIGTTYRGRKNASTRQSLCTLCNRTSTLRSYDTREFFCFLYIPIGPGEKYRIFDECPLCRRHRRMPLDEFRRTAAATIDPLRAAVENNRFSPYPHGNLIRALVAFRLQSEAEAAARAAVAAIPQPLLVLALHDDREALQLTGDCYMKLKEWPNALATFQSIRNPGRLALRSIAKCKKKLGRDRSREERRASHWWSSDRSKHQLRFALLFTAPIVILILAALARGAWLSRNIAVYFDSVIPHTTFQVDGISFPAGVLPVRQRLSPGRHHVVATDDSGATIEARDIDLPDEGMLNAITNRHAYVYNTLGLRVYARQTLEYTRDVTDAHSSEELVAMQPFIEIDDAGYVFEQPLQSITVSSNSPSSITRHGFQIAMSLREYAELQWREGNTAEAEKATRLIAGTAR